MSRIFEQLGSAPYGDLPGFRQPTTSGDAARAVASRVSELKDRILASLRRSPDTPDEVARRLGCTVLAVRPRFTELKVAGLIEKTGERRTNISGLKAHVWRTAA